MNEYLFYQHRYNTAKKTVKQNCVDWTDNNNNNNDHLTAFDPGQPG